MVVVKATSVICDMPDTIVFMDTDVFGSGQFLFIQSICNDLTDGMVDFPVFQYFFYVEVKFFSHILPFASLIPSAFSFRNSRWI